MLWSIDIVWNLSASMSCTDQLAQLLAYIITSAPRYPGTKTATTARCESYEVTCIVTAAEREVYEAILKRRAPAQRVLVLNHGQSFRLYNTTEHESPAPIGEDLPEKLALEPYPSQDYCRKFATTWRKVLHILGASANFLLT